MILGYKGQFLRHKKLQKSLETFFRKVQKNVKNGQKGPKMPILAKSPIFTKKGPRYVRAPMDAQLHAKLEKNP